MVADEGLWDAVLCDQDWQALVSAADAAGREAAVRLARRASEWELGRTGHVHVDVGPAESPLAVWLDGERCGVRTQDQHVRIEITLADTDLASPYLSGLKAHSLLVRWAYATAFATVLTDEAGAVATPCQIPDYPARVPTPRADLGTAWGGPDDATGISPQESPSALWGSSAPAREYNHTV